MLIEDDFLFLLSDRELYEPLDRYKADERDFADFVKRLAPPGWTFSRRSHWLHCRPPDVPPLPDQGWKIHLSATLGNAMPILSTAARTLFELAVPFKFVADRTLLFLVNSKRWGRGGAGKFIAVYPADEAQCRLLLDRFHFAMTGYGGPYVLSDRRYRDSSVVHYRYGGFRPRKRVTVDGRSSPVMQLGDGAFVDDERTAAFRLPPGVDDPFAEPAAAEPGEPGTLKQGRYRIESALSFSNSGGVYLAHDTRSGEMVVVKEARPFTSVSPRGTDAVWLLKKEHRLLTLLAATGVAPRPIDFFKDWEHYFLVEERIEGTVLRSYHVQISLSLRTRPTLRHAEEFFARYRSLYLQIAAALEVVHAHGIVFSDLSHYNVIVQGDGEGVRLIDFEGAHEEGVDLPTLLFTPGFASSRLAEGGAARAEDDRFSLGGLMLAGLLPINSLLALDESAHERFLAAMEGDLSLPRGLSDCIRGLLHRERSMRPTLPEVVRALASEEPVRPPCVTAREAEEVELESLVERILAHVVSTADFGREDRLFPADPLVFDTNPLSVAYGACGVAHVLQRVRGAVPREVVDWILRRPIFAAAYPPGLYTGLSGIAWTLLELGLGERAREVLGLAAGHHLLHRSPDLFGGLAGWGMTELRFFLATGDERHLRHAEQAGRAILDARQEEGGACRWTAEGDLCCGLAHGASGISLFLLYLFLATGREELLDVGRRGLEFVASRGIRNADGGITWYAKEGEPTYTPYWRWGSAGVGMVLLRYLRVVDAPPLAELLAGLLADTDRKYTIFPGRFFGLAGIGDFYLDLATLGEGGEEALRSARKALAGLLLFRLERATGLAFPGESRSRISCDYGTGGAGIALFAHRLRTLGPPSFLLDELLDRRANQALKRPRLRPSQGSDRRMADQLAEVESDGKRLVELKQLGQREGT